MAIIVDGKKIAAEILENLRSRVQKLKRRGVTPALAVVLVGDDKPSHTYVHQKQKAAEQIGVEFFRCAYPATIKKDALISEIKKIQKRHKLSGLIIQLPVPENLWPHTREIVNNIDIKIDVDCLSHLALGKVLMNASPLVPPTPGAILEILRYYKINLKNKNVCLIGRGDLIGRPLAAMLTHEPVALSIHGRSTKNLSDFTKTADIIITGVGKKNLLTAAMVKKGVVVVDAGVTFTGKQISGDVDFINVAKKARLITPVPGGVGPITVAKLLENTVISAENVV
jgi:methylenetetrahydrofolate dehydrogenase (NADP+)/methenyltetrahydrofolate cyclohydrolase